MLVAAEPADPPEDKRRRILDAARALIHETGNFDLPMRALAARAQLSLRTPYEYFGSKAGVIGAILAEDQAIYYDEIAGLPSGGGLENLLDRVRWGIDFYHRNEAFYRALFRATQAYTAGHNEEPTREVLRSYRILASRYQRDGLIREDVDHDLLGDILTDIWAANLRVWSIHAEDINLVGARIGLGFAAVLIGMATEPSASLMRQRHLEFQQTLKRMGSPAPTGPPAVPSFKRP